jgi:hypothetical protein
MVKTPVLYKSLVVGVIVLFIGVGIQPAFAVTPDTSDSDDCDICPAVSIVSELVDEEDNQKLSDMINEFVDVYSNVKPKTLDDRIKPICVILLILFTINIPVWMTTILLYLFFNSLPFNILLSLYIPIFNFIQEYYVMRVIDLFLTAGELDCNWAFSPPINPSY